MGPFASLRVTLSYHMSKKLVGLIVVILVIVGIWVVFRVKEEKPIFPVTPGEEEIEVKLKMGAGESIKLDEVVAVEEAYNEMMAELDGERPQFVVLYSEVAYDSDKILAEANRLLGSDVKIVGTTSLVGVMSNKGFNIGEKGSLAMLGFSSSEMTFGVGVADLAEFASAQEVGRRAALGAIEDAGKGPTEKPKLVLVYTGSFALGVDEDILSGILEVIEEDIPIVGGIASDTNFAGNWQVFANDKAYNKGVVIVAIYSDLKIGYKFLCGFSPTEIKSTVTKVAQGGRKIVEFDGRPADVVFNEWLDGKLTDKLGTSDFFIDVTCLYPLGEKIIEEGGIANYRLIYPHHFNPDGTLTVGADVKEGDELYLLEGSRNMLVERPALTARLARAAGEITEEEIAGVLMDYCSGTMLCIREEDRNDIALKINEAIAGAPFIGLYSCGEFGYFAGVGNRFGNCMSSMIVFSKR